MNKFILMIFSVSIFFIGLGGMVRQISSKFNFDKPHLVMLPRIENRISEQEKIDSLKSFTLIDNSKKRVLIKREKMEKPDADFQIKLQSPFPPDKIIEFHRHSAAEPLRQGAEFPRVNAKDTIIFFNKQREEIDTVKPNDSKVP